MSYENDTRETTGVDPRPPIGADPSAETGVIQAIVPPPGGGTPTPKPRPASHRAPVTPKFVIAPRRFETRHWAWLAAVIVLVSIGSMLVGIGLGNGTWGPRVGNPHPVSGAGQRVDSTPIPPTSQFDPTLPPRTSEFDPGADVDFDGDDARRGVPR